MSVDREAPGRGLIAAALAGLALRRVTSARRGGERDTPAPDAERGSETQDVRAGNTALAMAGLALSAMAAVATMAWMMSLFAAGQRGALPTLTPQQTARLVPPPPNLQPDPYADLDRERAAQAAGLSGYAYLDEGRTRARIPIERAMRLSVGRTLDPGPEGAAR